MMMKQSKDEEGGAVGISPPDAPISEVGGVDVVAAVEDVDGGSTRAAHQGPFLRLVDGNIRNAAVDLQYDEMSLRVDSDSDGCSREAERTDVTSTSNTKRPSSDAGRARKRWLFPGGFPWRVESGLSQGIQIKIAFEPWSFVDATDNHSRGATGRPQYSRW